MSGRCVSCNEILKDTELFWVEERKTHNDMCGSCRTKSKLGYINPNKKLKDQLMDLELWEAYIEQTTKQNIEE